MMNFTALSYFARAFIILSASAVLTILRWSVQSSSSNLPLWWTDHFAIHEKRGFVKEELATPTAQEYLGPWKMTVASSDPRSSGAFVAEYFAATPWPGLSPHLTDKNGGACITLDWCKFARVDTDQPVHWLLENFQLHFVKQFRRPTGEMSILQFEQRFADAYNDSIGDARVIFEAQALDPFAVRLGRGGVRFFSRIHKHDQASLYARIPNTTYFIEVQGPASSLTVVEPQSWDRCGAEGSARYHDHGLWSDASVAADAAGPTLVPVGFTYATTAPLAIVDFLQPLIGGTRVDVSDAALGGEACSTMQALLWQTTAGRNPMTLTWTHWRPNTRVIGEFEDYVVALHGNFSQRSANNWNHYMDYHMGFTMQDCNPLVARLQQAAVEYFFTPHLSVFPSILIRDPRGNVYEFTCPNGIEAIPKITDVQDWDFCHWPEEVRVLTHHGLL